LGEPDDDQQDERELARVGVVVAAKSAARLLSLTGDALDYGDDIDSSGTVTLAGVCGNSTAMITAGSAWHLIACDFIQP
jgi:hypothetical protein